jgi:AcrR family transcriptional regulator
MTKSLGQKRIKKSGSVTLRSDNRREDILDASARLFGSRGYASTSIRDIANAVGMLPGSIYYHFTSKEELLLAVHQEGVSHIFNAVQFALSKSGDAPWDRLEAASVAHLTALLTGGSYASVVTPEFHRGLQDSLKAQMIAQRDAYEALFRSLIDDLPLPRGTNRTYLRLSLLGSLNWTLNWYHAGGDTPAIVGKKMIGFYRVALDKVENPKP